MIFVLHCEKCANLSSNYDQCSTALLEVWRIVSDVCTLVCPIVASCQTYVACYLCVVYCADLSGYVGKSSVLNSDPTLWTLNCICGYMAFITFTFFSSDRLTGICPLQITTCNCWSFITLLRKVAWSSYRCGTTTVRYLFGQQGSWWGCRRRTSVLGE